MPSVLGGLDDFIVSVIEVGDVGDDAEARGFRCGLEDSRLGEVLARSPPSGGHEHFGVAAEKRAILLDLHRAGSLLGECAGDARAFENARALRSSPVSQTAFERAAADPHAGLLVRSGLLNDCLIGSPDRKSVNRRGGAEPLDRVAHLRAFERVACGRQQRLERHRMLPLAVVAEEDTVPAASEATRERRPCGAASDDQGLGFERSAHHSIRLAFSASKGPWPVDRASDARPDPVNRFLQQTVLAISALWMSGCVEAPVVDPLAMDVESRRVFAAPARLEDEEEPIWKERPHHLSVFPSGTRTTGSENEDAFTVGLDYEYRVSELLGVGAVGEFAFGPIDATTLLAVADFHIWRGLGIQTGPGAVVEDGESPHFVYRFGALYEFEFGSGFTLSPQIHCDLIDGLENELIYGLAFGFSF